jgi:hypothetical protein
VKIANSEQWLRRHGRRRTVLSFVGAVGKYDGVDCRFLLLSVTQPFPLRLQTGVLAGGIKVALQSEFVR